MAGTNSFSYTSRRAAGDHTLTPALRLPAARSARQSLTELIRVFPDLTIAQVRSGLPYRSGFLNRIADELESAGMRPC